MNERINKWPKIMRVEDKKQLSSNKAEKLRSALENQQQKQEIGFDEYETPEVFLKQVLDIEVSSVTVVVGKIGTIKIADKSLEFRFFWLPGNVNISFGINFSENSIDYETIALVGDFLSVPNCKDYLPENVFNKIINKINKLEIKGISEEDQKQIKSKAITEVLIKKRDYQGLDKILAQVQRISEQAERDRVISDSLEIINNIETPTAVLIELAESFYQPVKSLALEKLMTREDVDLEILKNFSQSDSSVRRRVAAVNPNTPPEILFKLAADPRFIVRRGVAANPSTPPEILNILLEDNDVTVKINLATRVDVSGEFLQTLAKNNIQNTQILVTLFANPKYPNRNKLIKECLGIGLDDYSKYIFCQQDLTGLTGYEIIGLIGEFNYDLATILVQNITTPASILIQIAHFNPYPDLLKSIVNRPKCEVSVLDKIVEITTEKIKSGDLIKEAYYHFFQEMVQNYPLSEVSLDLILKEFPNIFKAF